MRPLDFVSVKQLYKKIRTPGFKFYCVGCNRERRQSMPASIGSLPFFGHILITTAFLSLVTWPWLHWKGLFAFAVPVGLFFEAFYRIKMRAALVCPDCHFDPILYLSDRPKALQQVEEVWRLKFAEKNLPFPERRRRSVVSEKKPVQEDLT
jgi:hypothetical protein